MHGAGHGADLVAPAGGGDVAVVMPPGEADHYGGELAYRPGDASRGEQAGDDHQRAADDEDREHAGFLQRVEPGLRLQRACDLGDGLALLQVDRGNDGVERDRGVARADRAPADVAEEVGHRMGRLGAVVCHGALEPGALRRVGRPGLERRNGDGERLFARGDVAAELLQPVARQAHQAHGGEAEHVRLQGGGLHLGFGGLAQAGAAEGGERLVGLGLGVEAAPGQAADQGQSQDRQERRNEQLGDDAGVVEGPLQGAPRLRGRDDQCASGQKVRHTVARSGMRPHQKSAAWIWFDRGCGMPG